MTISTTEKTLTPKEAAGELGCHVYFVLAEVRARRMTPVYRINARVIRIPESTLSAYKRARVV